MYFYKKNLRLDELFEDFIKQRQQAEGYSPVTIDNYRQNFELLKKFRPDIRLRDLTRETMVDFSNFLNTRERRVGNKDDVVRPLKPSSLATVRGKLSSFFTWLKDNGYIKKNPFEDILYPQVDCSDRRAVTDKEFDKLYLAVERDIEWPNNLIKKRNLAILMFFALTGVRKNELLSLRLSDFDFEKRKVTVRAETSKSKKENIIRMPDVLMPYLDDYLAYRADYKTESFWVSGNRDCPFTKHGWKHLVNRLKAQTGIEKFHAHRFRHYFAVNFYKQSNCDLINLQRAMGHRSVKTTIGSYLRSLGNEELDRQMRGFRVAKNK